MKTCIKKIACPVIAAMLMLALGATALPATPAPAKTFSLEASANLLFPSDEAYREIYSGSVVFPEFRVGIHLSQRFFVFAGYAFISMDGLTPLWQLETGMKQNIFLLGAGWTRPLSSRLDLRISAGAALLNYDEEIPELNISNSDHCLGLVLDLGLGYALGDALQLRAGLGYLNFRESGNENPFSLGGFRTRLGLAFRF